MQPRVFIFYQSNYAELHSAGERGGKPSQAQEPFGTKWLGLQNLLSHHSADPGEALTRAQ